jgi:cobalt-precorrin-5B (C1)-methyltransferase
VVKLALGIVNTHSSHGDGRIEALIACALEAGAGIETLRELAACVSTDGAVAVLEAAALFQPAMRVLERRISETLSRLMPPEIETGFIVFCKEGRERRGKIAAQSKNAPALAAALKGEKIVV